MRLVKKSGAVISAGESGISQRYLSALKYDQGSLDSQKTLKAIHSLYWLECNCTGHDVNSPTLTIRANPNKTFSLVNISGRGDHRTDCPLSYDKLSNHLNLHLSSPVDIQEPSNLRSLFLIVTLIIERAKLNILADSSTFKNNKESATSIGTKNITIKSTPFDPLFNFGFRSFFTLREKPNDIGHYIMDVVDDINDEKGTVVLKDSNTEQPRFTFYRSITDIYIKADPFPSKNGAYIVLAYIGNNPKSKDVTKITPISVCILPIVSKQHWVFPNHPHYRMMYHGLLNAQSWYRKNKRLDIAITSPVRPKATDNGVCMPDFIISNEDKMHSINLLPDDNKIHVDNHLKSIDILRELGPVTEICFAGVKNVSNHIFEVNKNVLKNLCK
jgi:hypothetical protein